jgi:hypothetical protein
MKNESVISRIISAIKGNKVAIRENLFYDTVKGTVDFDDDDLVNKRYVDSSTGGIPPNPTVIVAGTTATPLVIAYSATSSPAYTLLRTSDNSYDNNTTVTYDGTNFTILGADDGTGKFADGYTFSIKP